MREKWRIHRGWIKVHGVIDRKSREIPAMDVMKQLRMKPVVSLSLIPRRILFNQELSRMSWVTALTITFQSSTS
jgi:hypothetical protein